MYANINRPSMRRGDFCRGQPSSAKCGAVCVAVLLLTTLHARSLAYQFSGPFPFDTAITVTVDNAGWQVIERYGLVLEYRVANTAMCPQYDFHESFEDALDTADQNGDYDPFALPTYTSWLIEGSSCCKNWVSDGYECIDEYETYNHETVSYVIPLKPPDTLYLRVDSIYTPPREHLYHDSAWTRRLWLAFDTVRANVGVRGNANSNGARWWTDEQVRGGDCRLQEISSRNTEAPMGVYDISGRRVFSVARSTDPLGHVPSAHGRMLAPQVLLRLLGGEPTRLHPTISP